MKIAIPTNDRLNIAERTGRAKEFAIIDITNKEFNILEFKKNEHKHHNDSEHIHHSHSNLIVMIEGVSVVIVKKVGQHLKSDLDNANIKIVLTQKNTINESVNEFIKNNKNE